MFYFKAIRPSIVEASPGYFIYFSCLLVFHPHSVDIYFFRRELNLINFSVNYTTHAHHMPYEPDLGLAEVSKAVSARWKAVTEEEKKVGLSTRAHVLCFNV